MNLIEVRKATPNELPYTLSTIYKFSSEKKYPSVILSIGGKLFFDMDEWGNVVEATRRKQVAEAKRIKAGLGGR